MKIMMYPKLRNHAHSGFEVESIKSEDRTCYTGWKPNGSSFHCLKSHWFKVETEIKLPWVIAPDGVTHFDSGHLSKTRFGYMGWMRIENGVSYRWHGPTQRWVEEHTTAQNLIPRPVEIDGITPPAIESDFSETRFAQKGRAIERLGKLMQDETSTIRDIGGAAHDAGLSLFFSIQPDVEETSDDG